MISLLTTNEDSMNFFTEETRDSRKLQFEPSRRRPIDNSRDRTSLRGRYPYPITPAPSISKTESNVLDFCFASAFILYMMSVCAKIFRSTSTRRTLNNHAVPGETTPLTQAQRPQYY